MPRFREGFEHGVIASWTRTAGTPVPAAVATNPRSGTYALELGVGRSIYWRPKGGVGSFSQTYWVRTGAAATRTFAFLANTTAAPRIGYWLVAHEDGTWKYFTGSYITHASQSGWAANTYYKVRIDYDRPGTLYHVWINDARITPLAGQSARDDQNQLVTSLTELWYRQHSGTGYFDDFDLDYSPTTDPYTGPAITAMQALASSAIPGLQARTWQRDANTISIDQIDPTLTPLATETVTAGGADLRPPANTGESYRQTRLEGWLKVDQPGEYWLTPFGDDQIRVWVDGNALVDNLAGGTGTGGTAPISLPAGYVAIRVDYANVTSGTFARLGWNGPDTGYSSQFVPAAKLFTGAPQVPAGGAPTPCINGVAGLNTRVWMRTLETYQIIDESLPPDRQYQETGDSANLLPNVAGDYWNAVIAGTVYVPVTGTYKFHAKADDTVGLQVSGYDFGRTVYAGDSLSGSLTLEQGYHPIRITHTQHTHIRYLTVQWQGPGDPGLVAIPAGNLVTCSTAPARVLQLTVTPGQCALEADASWAWV